MSLRFLDAEEVARRLPPEVAIAALEEGFRHPLPTTPLRTAVETPRGSLLLMPSVSFASEGVKLVTLSPGNPSLGLPLLHAIYVLFDGETQAPSLVLDGAALTAIRTAAVSGLATRYLSRGDSEHLVLFGAGVLARSHVDAMLAVRPIRRVTVVTRGRARGETLVDDLRSRGLDASLGGPDAVSTADIVCTCTTSVEPVFEGSLLAEGAHVNAVGAHQATTRELDPETIVRAQALVVETREVMMAEAGAVLMAMQERRLTHLERLYDMTEMVSGAWSRGSDSDVTVMVSTGVAFEDLFVASALLGAS